MRIKKYVASSVKEALLKIKEELGDNAVILKTRKIPRKLLSLHSHDQVEVTAAVDEQTVGVQPFKPISLSELGVYKRPRAGNAVNRTAETALPSVMLERGGKDENRTNQNDSSIRYREQQWQLLELREDVRELKELITRILVSGYTEAAGGFEGEWAILYKRMVDADIRPQIAQSVIKNIRDSGANAGNDVNKKFISSIGEHFLVSGPINLKNKCPAIIVFVGPTGSGKTTTLAKLAAYYCLNKNKNISIITNDTYRIAAIEQIRTFAEIMGIRLHVMFTPQEAAAIIEACRTDDVVFVDTAGRSRKHTKHMEEIAKTLEALKPDEIHLVLSATTKDSDLQDTVECYRKIGVNRLLFTKLDETSKLGNIFNTVKLSAIPVSYFTFGQSVPDDIELAQPGRFLQRLWEGSIV